MCLTTQGKRDQLMSCGGMEGIGLGQRDDSVMCFFCVCLFWGYSSFRMKECAQTIPESTPNSSAAGLLIWFQL